MSLRLRRELAMPSRIDEETRSDKLNGLVWWFEGLQTDGDGWRQDRYSACSRGWPLNARSGKGVRVHWEARCEPPRDCRRPFGL